MRDIDHDGSDLLAEDDEAEDEENDNEAEDEEAIIGVDESLVMKNLSRDEERECFMTRDSLVARLKQGNDAEAAGELAQLHEFLVCRNLSLVNYILRRRGIHSDNPDYEDLRQEGCIALYKSIIDFRVELGFRLSTYAFGKIDGAILDGLKSIKKASIRQFANRSEEQADFELESMIDQSADVYRQILEQSLKEAIRKELSHMTKKIRNVMELIYFDELTYEQIQEYFGISVSDAGARRQRGVNILRHSKKLKEFY
jgi:RNA polymerase sigma factor (sigma-70 family)